MPRLRAYARLGKCYLSWLKPDRFSLKSTPVFNDFQLTTVFKRSWLESMKKLLLAIPLAATLAAFSSTATDPAAESSTMKDEGTTMTTVTKMVMG